MSAIREIKGRQIVDSRGNPTVEAEVLLESGAMGRAAVKVLADGWTAVTKDSSLAAHFEHTVAVTANGPWVLTRP